MISFLVLIFALVLVSKLFLVQIVHKNSYAERADHQYITPSSDTFERGSIFFERKDGQLVSAAIQTAGFKIAINPSLITNEEEIYQKLSKKISLDYDEFITKAKKKNDPYEEIANRLSKEEVDYISVQKIPGVYVYREKWRFYPGGNLASHLLGFLGYKGNEYSGRYGLERQYNAVLSRDKDNPYINFFAEVFSNISDTFLNHEERKGDVITTIEPTVQGFLEKKLAQVGEKYQTDSIGGIIMNPMDGSIYAMGVKPDFDLNNFASEKKVSIFSNPLVENVFEFGSVVKPLVMAAGLDTGVVTASTKYEDKGSVMVEDKQIDNFDKKARGVVDMQEVLNQSLNTGMVFVSRKLGHENVRNYLLSYGIGKKTGIDLPNETSGLVSNLQSPRDLEYANASFGQGIAMTPIEIIRALASLSNGGNLVVPHVAKIIKYENGTEKDITYESIRAKISEKTSEEITRMLVTVMDKSLKGGRAKMEHYSVAVKTGTAQVAKENGQGYYEDRYLHSFFGYLPAYDPKFIIFLYAVNPKKVLYASQTWTDPFLDIAKFLLYYYEVPPDR
jgi:cell division protein FtsI/penicillin-binding protein 2